MNKWEKEVQESLLESEEEALNELQKQYNKALNDINQKIKQFESDIDFLDQALESTMDDAAREILLSQKRSRVYQKQFQEALQGQINGILEKMHSDNYSTIEGYLKNTYEDAYLGSMYDLANQGIPVITPINQAAATKAILTDSKISTSLYDALGVDVGNLKKTIAQTVSRGIVSALPYQEIANQISRISQAPLHRAMTITRTEGHRIQQQATENQSRDAMDHGADLVKKWDAYLDHKTRESHRNVDGEIREMDEPFSNGLMYPGDPNGSAGEVINCRCARLNLPRWAVDDGFSKIDGFSGEILHFKSQKDYEEFKKNYWSKENQEYMKYVQNLETKYGTKDFEKLLGKMSDTEYLKFRKYESLSPLGMATAGGKFVNNTEKLYRYSDKIPPEPGFTDFVCHADPDQFIIYLDGDEKKQAVTYTPKEYATMIRNSTSYQGGDIRIISCQAGAKENGAAKQLAIELGVKVKAPTEVVNVDNNGRMFISDNDILAELWYNAKEDEKKLFKETGKWIVFDPK